VGKRRSTTCARGATMNVELYVNGVPEPKGSKHLQRRGGNVWMMDGGSGKAMLRLKEWAFRVHQHAERTAKANGVIEVYDGPIGADITFYLPRPKSAAKRIHCAVKPDLDKLFRGALDPLMGVFFTEDSRIVNLSGRKVYADTESPPGALIKIWSVG
jgi:Holliday junction resolvase RusA-like endonuclease